MIPRTAIVLTALTLAAVALPASSVALDADASRRDGADCASLAHVNLRATVGVDPADVVAAAETLPVTFQSHDTVTACPGIRPGGALVLRAGPLTLAYCTLAFVVEDTAGDLYVATAGHCTDPELGIGPRVSAYGVPGTFGEEAFRWCEGSDSLGNGCGPGADFSLIKVDADKHQYVDAAMCHWGAPTGGLFTARDNALRLAPHFGWGMGVGSVTSGFGASAGGSEVVPGNPATQARLGVGTSFTEESYAIMESVAAPGDSGSGVMLDSLGSALPGSGNPQALGVLTHAGLGGATVVQRLDASLERAGDALGTTFTVVS